MNSTCRDVINGIIDEMEATRQSDLCMVADMFDILRRSDSATLRKLLVVARTLDRISARSVKA